MRIDLPPTYDEKAAKKRFLDEFESRSEREQEALRAKIGITIKYFKNIQKDRIGKYHPSLPLLVKIAWAVNKSTDYFLYGKDVEAPEEEKLINIPHIENYLDNDGNIILKECVAGCYYNYRWLKLLCSDPAKLFCMAIYGDNMDCTLVHGDRVKIDTNQRNIINSGIYAFHFKDDKQIIIMRLLTELGKIVAVSDNPKYNKTTISYSDIVIIGQVILSKRLYIMVPSGL